MLKKAFVASTLVASMLFSFTLSANTAEVPANRVVAQASGAASGTRGAAAAKPAVNPALIGLGVVAVGVAAAAIANSNGGSAH